MVNNLPVATSIHWHGLEVARDGADGPIEWQIVEPARVRVQVGTMVDVEFTPEAGKEYRLVFEGGFGAVEVPLVQ